MSLSRSTPRWPSLPLPQRRPSFPRPAWFDFLAHALEMVVAMLVAMAVFDLAVGPIAAALGSADPMRDAPVPSLMVMAVEMTAGMALWMAVRGHAARAIVEMSAAMVVPAAALIAAHAAGAIPATVLHDLYHPLMYAAMFGVLLLRRGGHAAHPATSGPDRAVASTTRSYPASERATLRLGAVAIAVGPVLQVVVSGFHPSRIDPNRSTAVFLEYAADTHWTLVHIGQAAATAIIAFGIIVLGRSLRREPGLAGALALVGTVAAGVVLAIFTVQMAVDGVVLKEAIAAWIAADDPAARAATFSVAESVRWLEKGLSGFFHLANGTSLLALGGAILAGRAYPWPIGLAGIAAGVGFLGGGVSTAHTGFSAAASGTLSTSLLFVVAFFIGSAIAMWRRAR